MLPKAARSAQPASEIAVEENGAAARGVVFNTPYTCAASSAARRRRSSGAPRTRRRRAHVERLPHRLRREVPRRCASRADSGPRWVDLDPLPVGRRARTPARSPRPIAVALQLVPPVALAASGREGPRAGRRHAPAPRSRRARTSVVPRTATVGDLREQRGFQPRVRSTRPARGPARPGRQPCTAPVPTSATNRRPRRRSWRWQGGLVRAGGRRSSRQAVRRPASPGRKVRTVSSSLQ